MSEQTTEWVTISVPKSIRDECRDYLDGVNQGRHPDDQLTYGDLMAKGLHVEEVGTDKEIAKRYLEERLEELENELRID